MISFRHVRDGLKKTHIQLIKYLVLEIARWLIDVYRTFILLGLGTALYHCAYIQIQQRVQPLSLMLAGMIEPAN